MHPPRPFAIVFTAALAWGLACGGGEPSGIPGAPGSAPGASAPEPAVPAAVAQHGAAVAALIAQAPAVLSPERLALAPIERVEVELDDLAATYRGRLVVELVHPPGAAEPLREVAFALWPNVGLADPRERLLTLEGVSVDGREVEPRGSAALLRVPVAVAPGEGARIVMRFAGRLPAVPAAEDELLARGQDLLGATLGGVGVAAEAAAFRRGEAVLALGRPWPALVEPGARLAPETEPRDIGAFAPSIHDVTLIVAPELVLATVGVEVARTPQQDGRVAVRILAPGAREFALVGSRSFEVERERVAGVDLSVYRVGAARGVDAQVLTSVRRALESLHGWFGRPPWPALAVVEAPLGLQLGVVSFPGLVAVSDLHYSALAPTDREGDLVAAVLSRHPSLREGLDLFLARAVVRQWWGHHIAFDRAASPFAAEGLVTALALLHLGETQGASVVARQRELMLKLPYQLARAVGAIDRPLSAPARAMASDAEAAGLTLGKAGLFFDTLARTMSATLFLETLRDLRGAYAHRVLPAGELLDRLIAAAPQPEVARALITRWVDGAHGDEDIGGPRPALLFEHLIADAAKNAGLQELIGLLVRDGGLEELAGALSGGDGDVGVQMARAVARKLAGDAPPGVARWLELGAELFGDDTAGAVGGLVGHLGQSLGLDEGDAALLEDATSTLIDLIRGATRDDAPPGSSTSGD